MSKLTNGVFADIPRDCAEAASWGVRNGIDYSKEGEILIAPNDVTPFLAYCDYSLDPSNRESVIPPSPQNSLLCKMKTELRNCVRDDIALLGSPSLTVPTVIVRRKATLKNRAQELCESRGGRPGLPVPNKLSGFYGRKATLKNRTGPV